MKRVPLHCICPKCNAWIFEDQMPTDVCPLCGEPIGHIVWKHCPRCSLPTDASQPMCQNCSATFDSLYDDEVIGHATHLYINRETWAIDGVVSKDTAESPWSSQEDVKALMIQLTDGLVLHKRPEDLEILLSRLIARYHYWVWVYGRGGTAIPIPDEPVVFEAVEERIGVFGTLSFPLKMKMMSIARNN